MACVVKLTSLKINFIPEDVPLDCGTLPFEFEWIGAKEQSPFNKSLKSPSKRKQQVKWSEEDDRILKKYAEKEYSWKVGIPFPYVCI